MTATATDKMEMTEKMEISKPEQAHSYDTLPPPYPNTNMSANQTRSPLWTEEEMRNDPNKSGTTAMILCFDPTCCFLPCFCC